MISIILCGKMSDTSISEALLPVLARYGGVQYYSSQNLVQYGGDNVQFLVYDCEKIPNVELKKGILLFKNSFDSTGQIHVPGGFFCVLEAQNVHAASLLRGSDVFAVTCGTSPKDTISIAALEEESAALSLQRNLITLEEKTLEPHDFTIQLSAPLGPHRILAVSAILLISGIDSSQGYVI